MTYEEITAMIAEMAEEVGVGCRYTYEQWPPEDPERVPSPPYILFAYPENNDFFADNINYQAFVQLRIELYTDYKDFAAEAAVERVLRRHELHYEKTSEYITEERMNMALYDTEVCINGNSE